ncbi:WecB/TagA/CpsF family glycosyltransferase [Shewanella aestuarii]|uniref:WecB/TagA/CpsF family glycosyltransferase n=1 Tax=Shewanella aestuarii TaxID=1028752 RepID=A0A6G9QLV3_9GAMM|nr:WecB/TagA/CpsF family glycosyltransferase [Shewanella aestuarii]QIR15103.1 WecB/TagA/CpsF family glycosyltransferase [Shewanella aestuarii]
MNNIASETVLGFRINAYHSIEHAVQDIINNHLEQGHMAIAMNPEKVIASIEDKGLEQTLNDADILYADGVGVTKVLSRKLAQKVARIPGCELWEALMKTAGAKKLPVFILGGSDAVNQETCSKLKAQYDVVIAGAHNGYFDDEQAIIRNMIESGAQIVTVALGSPKQELLIKKAKAAGCNAFFMGVGGTYDVFTGNVQRAPAGFRRLGLEWLFRLLKQPSRVFRQQRLVKYTLMAFFNKL